MVTYHRMSYYIINQMLNVITKKKAGKDTYNKKTLTGPTNCKKTTRHHGHLTLCAKSRKTNDAKSKNGQKPQFGQFFFDDFEVKYLQIAIFSEK